MTTSRRPAISVVINTRNEEARLGFALRSVLGWTDEVVVVDMESDDRTREIAIEAGARVIAHAAVGFVEPARGAGVEAARGDWVLILDADEIVPPALGRRLREVAAGDRVDAVRIGRRNVLLGAEVRHSGWNPDRDRHLRFFRRGHVRLPAALHGTIRAAEGSRVLDLPTGKDTTLLHFNYVDLDDVLARMMRYASIEAAQGEAAGLSTSAARAWREAAREWAVRYLWHGGWRDGWRGVHLAWLMAAGRLLVHAKRAERRHAGSREEVERRYREQAERVLSEEEGEEGVRS